MYTVFTYVCMMHACSTRYTFYYDDSLGESYLLFKLAVACYRSGQKKIPRYDALEHTHPSSPGEGGQRL